MAEQHTRNLAARAGGWSAAHWKRATFAWLLFAAVAILLGGWVGTKMMKDSDYASGEAAQGIRMLDNAGFRTPATESVLVQSPDLKAPDPPFQSAIAVVVQMVALQKDVTNIRNPLESPATQVSKDGHSALVQFDVRGERDDAKDKVQPILDAVATAQHANPSFRVEEFGYASSNHVLSKIMEDDFSKAEKLTLPITLVILLLAFGALVAAGIPVVLAFSAVLAATGINQLVSHALPASDATKSIIVLVGMAVGVDYSLFYLRREREERARGASPHDSLIRAAATSGRAVLISGGTVLVAMAGMFLAGNRIFTSVALGTMFVVLAAVIGSLSVLPALLHKVGDHVEKGRVPFLWRLRRPAGESRFWGWILKPVLRWPAAAVILAGGVLAATAVPVLGIHTKLSGFTDLPRVPIMRTYDRIQKAFPGSQTPVEVVVKGEDVSTAPYDRAYAEAQKRALASGELFQPFHVFRNPDKTVARIEASIAGSGDNAASYHALETLRNDVIAPLEPMLPPGTQVAVTGQTAGTYDFNQMMKERAPLVIGFVLLLAFLLLLVTFRSIVVPLTAIVLNLLSVGAAYGLLIMIFQWGHLESVLGFRSSHAIAAWLPLFLFVILFGLSMDYHVFIVSRIKELHDSGLSTEEAVARGIRSTAGTVTAAAIVMVAVFGIFAGLREIEIKQMGVGLALAILIDATVIRAMLLPSTMKLLGDWNWYLPRRLEWIPRLVPEESEQTPRGPAVPA